MRWIFVGMLCLLSSWFMLEKVPDSQFYFHEIESLDYLYQNPASQVKELHNDYPQKDLERTKRLIEKYNLKSDNTVQYLMNVISLLRKFETGELRMQDTVLEDLVYRRFQESLYNGVKIDCGRYTDFISVFMLAEGIPFRRVDAHFIPDTAIGAHSFQEIYIKEKEQWAYVDITNDKILMRHKNGDFVTVKDVYECVQNGQYNDIGIYSYKKENNEPLLWAENIVEEDKCFDSSIMLLYYNTSLEKAYNGYGLFKRRFFITDWVTHFNAPFDRSNLLYYFRVFLIYVGVILVLLGMFLIIKNRQTKKVGG